MSPITESIVEDAALDWLAVNQFTVSENLSAWLGTAQAGKACRLG